MSSYLSSWDLRTAELAVAKLSAHWSGLGLGNPSISSCTSHPGGHLPPMGYKTTHLPGWEPRKNPKIWIKTRGIVPSCKHIIIMRTPTVLKHRISFAPVAFELPAQLVPSPLLGAGRRTPLEDVWLVLQLHFHHLGHIRGRWARNGEVGMWPETPVSGL